MTEVSESLRRVAFAAAYRMLGSVTDAEDVAQTAIERLLRLPPADQPTNAEAWVTTVATRIAIDELRSARARREEYVGEWLPEPLVGGPYDAAGDRGSGAAFDAARHAELADELSFAFLVLLETLTPSERAAFLLHDVLDFSYPEVASALDRPSQEAARQLVSRARARISGRVPRYPASVAEQHELVSRFIAAVEAGEVADFVSLLTTDVSFTGDGGGKVPPGFAVSRPLYGFDAVAKLLAAFHRLATFPAHLEPHIVNGGPGVVVVADLPVGGGVMGVLSLDVRDGRVAAINGVVNPDKLRHLEPTLGTLADFGAVQRVVLEERRRLKQRATGRDS
ncbi:RNA polymerase sigma-70 factor [Humibacter soli]